MGGQSSSKFYANNAPNTAGNHDNSMSVWSTESGSLDTWAHVAFVVDRVNGKCIYIITESRLEIPV